MNEQINHDAAAEQDVSRILVRYAGLSPDGIRPVRNADGIFKHWLDPTNGNTKSGWPDEYATLSTMPIVAAAARAMNRYPDNPTIVRAAGIIFLTNWDAYLQAVTDATAFKGLAGGGPDTTSWGQGLSTREFVFAEQCGAYGTAFSQTIEAAWFNRPLWHMASYIAGRPITVGSQNVFQPAFISLYPALLSAPYRADMTATGWRTQVDNVRWSNAAFTDDNATRYYAVMSAGTVYASGGYNADTLTNHPGNVSTFTSLLGCHFGDPAEAVGAYAAYRKGARQTFKSGASILYRRPYDSGTFVPNSAGLPDVGLGGLGLAEIAQPGAIEQVLAHPYPTAEMCPQDVDGDGRITIDDLYAATASPTDLNGDGVVDAKDIACLERWLRRSEMMRMAAGQRP